MAIDWNAFYANGGYSNENSDPASYDDGRYDDTNDDADDDYNQWLFDNIITNNMKIMT